jgi:hypothetical protein
MKTLYPYLGHLTIDEVDAATELGFVPLMHGLTDWLLMPERKDGFMHDWKDEDGIEVDLEHVYWKEKKVSMTVVYIVDSEREFWDKYKATEDLLVGPGLRTIYIRELEKEFEAYYVKSSNPKLVQGIKDVDCIVYEVDFHFVMPNPRAIVDKLISPTGVVLTVGNVILGEGNFSSVVYPTACSQRVHATLTPLTGDAYVSGNTIFASEPGTVVLRVTSAVDGSVYDEKTINVIPSGLIYFADYSVPTSGRNYVKYK